MLVALSIRDIVLIDRLSIDFTKGMTVLTGETGAGKSILLDSLSLALGGRGDSALGLGLPLTRQFVEAHGGTVELVSANGEGTEVTITLPREAS